MLNFSTVGHASNVSKDFEKYGESLTPQDKADFDAIAPVIRDLLKYPVDGSKRKAEPVVKMRLVVNTEMGAAKDAPATVTKRTISLSIDCN